MTQSVDVLFLGHSVRKLEQMERMIQDRLPLFPPERLWQKSGAEANSVGNLVLHLCGNVRYYIGHGLGGQPNVRDREAECSSSGHDDLAGLLRATLAEATATLAALPPGRLPEPVPAGLTVPAGVTTVLELIYQIVGHFQQHTGQIIFAAKQL
ncbi:MAG: DinB family protein [Acidobacteriota bacterium]